jgi:PII-like signaling protein
MVVKIVDSEEQIDGFLPVLHEMMESGLVTFERVREMMESGLVTLEAAKVLQYGRQRTGRLQRIKEHVGRRLHVA